MDDRPLIIAAHKLFLGLPEAVGFARRLRAAVEDRSRSVEVVVSPSLVNLAHVTEVLKDSPIAVAAQDVHQEMHGAFTGQVSLEELLALGVRYTIVGHREAVLHRSNLADGLAAKIQWCGRHGVQPIVFVTDGADDSGAPLDGMSRELRTLFASSLQEARRRPAPLIVYEPRAGTSCETQEDRRRVRDAMRRIREDATAVLGVNAAGRPRLLYGGGVNPRNVRELIRDLDTDGFIVGRASLELASFLAVVDAVHDAIVETRAATIPASS
jgi:triosephosphate isomerase (TIM)